VKSVLDDSDGVAYTVEEYKLDNSLKRPGVFGR
jgi:hypothetical protein